MFSTDQNIETIGQLVTSLKRYLSLQGEYVKLDVTEKAVRLITALLLFFIFMVILLGVMTFLSFAAVCALAPLMGYALAFCVVAGVYLLLFLFLFLFRKQWIEGPLVRFLASLLLSGNENL